MEMQHAFEQWCDDTEFKTESAPGAYVWNGKLKSDTGGYIEEYGMVVWSRRSSS